MQSNKQMSEPYSDPVTLIRHEMTLPREPACVSLSDALRIAEPRFDRVLVDAPGFSKVHVLARAIPMLLSPFWGMEIRLGDSAPSADFLWLMDRNSVRRFRRNARGRHGSAVDLARRLRSRSPYWREFGRFAGEWTNNREWGGMHNIWFEVDVASMPDAELAAGLDRPNMFFGAKDRESRSGRDLIERLGELGRRFYGLETDPAWFRHIAATIPEGSLVFQMGIMAARTSPATRLCVKNPDMAAHERWLGEIGWPGDMESLRGTLNWLRPRCGEIALNVDILPEAVGANLGIEIYGARQELLIDTWLPLFEELGERGLARDDKLMALRKIPWTQRFRQLGVWLRDPPIGFPQVTVNLHHLKVTLAGTEPSGVKAYVGIYFPVFRFD